jgi:hypothetical protein
MTIAQAYCLHEPNWADDIQSRFSWVTSIKTGIKLNERRSQLKSWPRRSLSYTVDLNVGAERNAFLELMWNNFHKIFGVPWWPERSNLTVQASSGQPVLQFDTEDRSFAQGQSVVVMSDYSTYEVGIILSTTASSITLSTNLGSTWPVGTPVYPLLQCQLDSKSSDLKQVNSTAGSVKLSFKETYEADAMYITFAHSFPSYNGFPIFNKEPNWIAGCRVEYLQACRYS